MSFAVERELTRKAYPVLPPKKRLTAHIENITLRGALDWLCGLDRRYSWSSDGKTINLFPSEVRDDPTYPLNQRIGTLKLDHISSIPAAVIQAAKNTSPPQQIAVLGFGETQYATPIDLRFSDITLREALNQIARAIGPTYGWQFSGTEDFHYMVFHDYLIPDTPAISSSANSGKK